MHTFFCLSLKLLVMMRYWWQLVWWCLMRANPSGIITAQEERLTTCIYKKVGSRRTAVNGFVARALSLTCSQYSAASVWGSAESVQGSFARHTASSVFINGSTISRYWPVSKALLRNDKVIECSVLTSAWHTIDETCLRPKCPLFLYYPRQ